MIVPDDWPGARSLERILVPTDFSVCAGWAAERAVSLASQSNAVLTLLHVIDINAQRSSRTPVSASQMMKYLWKQSAEEMLCLARSLKDRVVAQTTLEEGLPWEEIVERSRHADLVVLGKCDSKRRFKFFSSHTAERVIKHSHCPVMIVSESVPAVSSQVLDSHSALTAA